MLIFFINSLAVKGFHKNVLQCEISESCFLLFFEIFSGFEIIFCIIMLTKNRYFMLIMFGALIKGFF